MNNKRLFISYRFISAVLLFFLVSANGAYANGVDDRDEYTPDHRYETQAEITEHEPGPNPQRLYCKKYWNNFYAERNIDIVVSTRGKHDEIVVFNCPECSLEENFVKPFLNAQKNGMTGAERIRACGFKQAVFLGAKGIVEIRRDI